jgi:hypothetical protein
MPNWMLSPNMCEPNETEGAKSMRSDLMAAAKVRAIVLAISWTCPLVKVDLRPRADA